MQSRLAIVLMSVAGTAALASAIRAFASNREGARAMGERGRAHVARSFDRRAHGTAFAKLISAVASTDSRGRSISVPNAGVGAGATGDIAEVTSESR